MKFLLITLVAFLPLTTFAEYSRTRVRPANQQLAAVKPNAPVYTSDISSKLPSENNARFQLGALVPTAFDGVGAEVGMFYQQRNSNLYIGPIASFYKEGSDHELAAHLAMQYSLVSNGFFRPFIGFGFGIAHAQMASDSGIAFSASTRTGIELAFDTNFSVILEPRVRMLYGPGENIEFTPTAGFAFGL